MEPLLPKVERKRRFACINMMMWPASNKEQQNNTQRVCDVKFYSLYH